MTPLQIDNTLKKKITKTSSMDGLWDKSTAEWRELGLRLYNEVRREYYGRYDSRSIRAIAS